MEQRWKVRELIDLKMLQKYSRLLSEYTPMHVGIDMLQSKNCNLPYTKFEEIGRCSHLQAPHSSLYRRFKRLFTLKDINMAVSSLIQWTHELIVLCEKS